MDDALRRCVRPEQPKRLIADDPEAVRDVRGQRDRVAPLEHDRLLLLTVDPGLGSAIENVEDLEVGMRVHRGDVSGLRGLDAGANRRETVVVADDGLVAGERTERDDLDLAELHDLRVAHGCLLAALSGRAAQRILPRVCREIPLRPLIPWGIRRGQRARPTGERIWHVPPATLPTTTSYRSRTRGRILARPRRVRSPVRSRRPPKPLAG